MRPLVFITFCVALTAAGVYLRTAPPGGTHSWNGVMKVEITPEVAHRTDDIRDAMTAITRLTNWTVTELVPSDPRPDTWVQIKLGASQCASYIGKVSRGPQTIQIANRCTTGSIIHELMHAAGILHEHTRSDRDEFVNVGTLCANSNNYKQDPANYVDFGPYDLDSLMHYTASQDPSNRCIAAVDPEDAARTGRRFTVAPDSGELLSNGDIAMLSFLAGSTEPSVPSPCACPSAAVCASLVDKLAAAAKIFGGGSADAEPRVWYPGLLFTE